jgi:hypothetical protein
MDLMEVPEARLEPRPPARLAVSSIGGGTKTASLRFALETKQTQAGQRECHVR